MKPLTRHILQSCTSLALLALTGLAVAQVYTYDEMGRLRNAAYPSGASIAYTYDLNGNITSITHTGVAAPLAPDGVIDTPADDVTIEAGQSVDFTGTGGDPDGALPLAYHWDFDGGAADSNDEDPGPTTFDTEGAYRVEFTVTDATGISDPTPDTVTVTVQAAAPTTNNPPPQTVEVKSGSGAGAVLWLPGLLLLLVLRRIGLRALLPLLLVVTAQAAEWVPMNSPTTEQLNAVWGSSPDAVYAVGDNGTVLFFDGDAWNPLDLGLAGIKLNKVWGRSADDVYIVGGGDTIMHFDGQAWSPIQIGETGQTFVDIWSPGPGERLWLLAVRAAWYYDGTSWVRQGFTEYLTRTLTPNSRLTSIGGTKDYVVVTGEPLTSAVQSFFVNFDDVGAFKTRDVQAFSDTEMFAVGEVARRLDGGDAEKVTDWKSISVSSAAYAVWGSSPNDMFAVGALSRLNTGYGAIFHYDGNPDNTWERVLLQQSILFNDVFGFGPGDVFVVGEDGTILRYFEAPPPATAANFPYSAMATPNVNAHTGELIRVEQDLAVGHLMPVVFERYYASGLLNDTRVGGALGRNWTHNYEWNLVQRDNNGVSEISVISPRGRVITFQNTVGEWELVEPLAVPFILVENDAEFMFADPVQERIYHFDKLFFHLTGIEDRNGNRLYLNYVQDTLTSVDDKKGNELVFEYTDVNRLGSVYTIGASTSPSPELRVRFDYTNGNLTSVTDPEGRVTSYEYDATRETRALLQAVHLPLSTERRWTYDENRRVDGVQIVEGGDIAIAYNELDTVVTNPDMTTCSYAHNQDGTLRHFEDELHNVRTYEYDRDGRVRRYVDGIGREFNWTYHGGSFKVETAMRPDQLGFTYHYEQNGSKAGIPFYDVIRVDLPDATSVSMQNDSFGNVTQVTDRNQNVWTLTRNEFGQLETETNPQTGTTEYVYWSHGALQDVRDTTGFQYRLLYDGYRRLSRIEFADQSRREFVWNDRGDIRQLTTELGEVFDFSYGADGKLDKVTDSSGNYVSYRYNGRGAVEKILKPGEMAERTTLLDYDSFARLAGVTLPQTSRVALGYDGIGQLNAMVDGLDATWKLERDAEGTAKSIDPPGDDFVQFDNTDNALRLNTYVKDGDEPVTVQRDPMGNISSISDGAENLTTIARDDSDRIAGIKHPVPGVETTVERNEFGRVSKRTEPEGGTWNYDFDKQGRVRSVEDPLKRVTRVSYDERNRPQKVTFPDGAGDVTVGYNGANQITVQQFSDGTRIETDFDTKGRLRSGDGIAIDYNVLDQLDDSNGIGIRYDDNDRIERITMAPGRWIEYRYNERGDLKKVIDWLGAETDIDRTPRGRVGSVNLPNGVSNVYAYDRAGRVTDIAFGAIGSISLTRDWRGFITSATRQLPGPQDIATEQRLFDFDVASQVTRFDYDSLRNLRRDDSRGYDFNLASRLTEYDGDNGRVLVTYDALGNPIASETTTRSRNFVWNYAFSRERIAVEQQNGQDRWYYVYTTDGRLLYRVNGDGIRHFYHFDENGNTVFLTDNGGNVIQTYFYSPLGEVLDQQGAVDNDRRFAAEFGGMQMDGSELEILEGRILDPARGIGLTPVRPAEFQLFNYANQALIDLSRKTDGLVATDNPAAGSGLGPQGEALAQDTLANTAGLTMAAGEKLIELEPLTGKLFNLPLNGVASTTFKIGGAFTAGFSGGMAAARQSASDEYKSDLARTIAIGGVGITNTAASAHPVTSLIMLGVQGADAVLLNTTGDVSGIPDIVLNSVVLDTATLVEATWGGAGWEAVRKRSDHVHEKEGWGGRAIAWVADNVVGPGYAEAWNIVSGERSRQVALDAQIWWENLGVDRVE